MLIKFETSQLVILPLHIPAASTRLVHISAKGDVSGASLDGESTHWPGEQQLARRETPG